MSDFNLESKIHHLCRNPGTTVEKGRLYDIHVKYLFGLVDELRRESVVVKRNQEEFDRLKRIEQAAIEFGSVVGLSFPAGC